MDKTVKTQNLQRYLHHPQHFHPLKSYDAPCTHLVSERYTENIVKSHAIIENQIKPQIIYQIINKIKLHQLKRHTEQRIRVRKEMENVHSIPMYSLLPKFCS